MAGAVLIISSASSSPKNNFLHSYERRRERGVDGGDGGRDGIEGREGREGRKEGEGSGSTLWLVFGEQERVD